MRRRSAPVKAPFSWPNSSDSSRFSRDGGAVDGQERRLGAGAVLVDGAGDQLLAGATLARDQHGYVLGGDAADGLVHLAHRRAAPHDGFALDVVVRRRLRDDGRLAHQAGDLQGLADHPVQLLHVERLEQVIVSPLPHRLDGGVRRPRQGDKHDRDAGVKGADLVQDLQARLVRQAQVEENYIRGRGRDALEALAPRVGDLDAVCGGGEEVAHLLRQQLRVIIDEQQVGHDALPFNAPDNARRCLPGIVFAILRVGPTRLVREEVHFRRTSVPAAPGATRAALAQ
jgi:hypothetical protein